VAKFSSIDIVPSWIAIMVCVADGGTNVCTGTGVNVGGASVKVGWTGVDVGNTCIENEQAKINSVADPKPAAACIREGCFIAPLLGLPKVPLGNEYKTSGRNVRFPSERFSH
jgi:hypothetical protein